MTCKIQNLLSKPWSVKLIDVIRLFLFALRSKRRYDAVVVVAGCHYWLYPIDLAGWWRCDSLFVVGSTTGLISGENLESGAHEIQH
mmetsp:Transcript_27220/g.75095  ORF Transcript_27220/g.75095 Transcript_27220/m.75095 type:complete len:86 (-) Transcript_27220:1312-1569(-)